MTENKKTYRLEPNPFKTTTIKVKVAQSAVNSAGQALRDGEGRIRKTDIDANSTVLIPGTQRWLGIPVTSNGLLTGLNIMVDNPYEKEEIYNPIWGESVLKGKPKILLQHYLEYKHGREFNYYTNKLNDRVEPSVKVPELPFFLTPHSKPHLTGNVMFFTFDNPIHEIWYYLFKANHSIANSYQELEEGKNQRALYYMVEDDSYYDPKLEKAKKMNKAAAALEKLQEDGESSLYMMARAIGNTDKNLNGKKAYSYINSYFLNNEENLSIFMKYFELYNDAGRREYLVGASKLEEYVIHGIVKLRDKMYVWVKPETENSTMRKFEWSSKEQFVKDFLIAPEYSDDAKILENIYLSKR